jgi:uncharacterized protein YegP (UPF0339 family)
MMADYKLEIYKDKKDEFRWRRFSPANGKQIGKST